MSGPEYPVMDWLPLLSYGDEAADINQHIVTDIISHPTELPTERELVYVLTATDDRTEAAVRDQLTVLCEADLVTTYDYRGYTFYGLTDAGKQFIVDSRQYRGHAVLKEVYERLERPEDIQMAYEAKRPKHPPTEREYDEQARGDSDAWTAAREATFRTLVLSLERTGETTFQAQLVEADSEAVLAVETFEVESVGEWTDDYRENEYLEQRGTIVEPDAYGIEVERDGTTYKVQPEKGGEGWHDFIERSLYVFTK